MDIVMVCNCPGEESIGSGGLLAKYTLLGEDLIAEKDRPYVIFSCISDYERKDSKFISKYQQFDEIERASKLLQFNWEFLYEGRKYRRNLRDTVGLEKFIKDLKIRMDFLNPKTVISPYFLNDYNNYTNYNFIADGLNNVWLSKPFNYMQSIIVRQYECVDINEYIKLMPMEIDLKRKAILCYSSLIDYRINFVDEIVNDAKNFSKLWKISSYCEPYKLIKGLI